jgi:hypothetical protein
VAACDGQIAAYVAYLDRDVIPRTSGDFTIGAANLSRRYLAEELIDTPLEAMVAIGERELTRSQAEFRAAAAKLDPKRDPVKVWEDVRKDHPKMGGVVAATQAIVDSLSAFVARAGSPRCHLTNV